MSYVLGNWIPATSLMYCLAIAEAPATTGVAIELPLIVMFIGVDEPSCVESEHAPPVARFASSALAEHIIIPGATKSGLIRPSEVGPKDELSDTEPMGSDPKAEVVDTPTESTFFAVLGEVTPDWSMSPAEKIIRNSG